MMRIPVKPLLVYLSLLEVDLSEFDLGDTMPLQVSRKFRGFTAISSMPLNSKKIH